MNVNQHHHHHQTNNVVGGGTLITTNGQIGTIQTSQGPMQIQLNGPPPPPSSNDMITNGYGTIGGTHHHHVDHSTTTYHLVGPDGTLISVCIRYPFIFFIYFSGIFLFLNSLKSTNWLFFQQAFGKQIINGFSSTIDHPIDEIRVYTDIEQLSESQFICSMMISATQMYM